MFHVGFWHVDEQLLVGFLVDSETGGDGVVGGCFFHGSKDVGFVENAEMVSRKGRFC